MSLESRKSGQIDDPGAELLDRASGLWSRFGRIILGIVAVAAVAVGLMFFWTRSQAAKEDDAAGKLAEANLLYWQGDYARSLTIARQVSEQFDGTPSGLDALRIAGDDAFWSGDFKTATEEYRRYLEKDKNGPLSDAVRRSYAYALESTSQFDEASRLYDGLAGKFDRESSAEFLVASARCQMALHRPEEAIKRLQRVLDEFAETSSAASARVRLAEIQASR